MTKVLVVDDDAPARDMLSELFKKENYFIQAVASAEEAIKILGKEDFNVVLLDVKLKGMSGLEALKKIKETVPSVAVIMITGFGYDNDLIAKSKEYGCDGYIGKNMPIPQIISNFNLFVKKAKEKK